jgi:site-specific DNA recombinase
MRLVGYIRVSRTNGREGDDFISPELQRRQVGQFAASRGHEVVAWHTDLDESGGKASRPQFNLAMETVESGAADGIAVAKLDRFMRSTRLGLAAVDRLQAANGQLLSASEQIDTTTPTGQFVLTTLLGIAEMERTRIAEGWVAATGSALEKGKYISGRVPTGYTKGPDKRLVPDLAVAPTVLEVFRRRARGATWVELAELLNSVCQTPWPNCNRWTGQAVKRLVANVAYLGHARQGLRVNESAHKPLVTRAEWEAAQRSVGAAVPRGNGLLLTGLVVCASCSYRMKGSTSRGSYYCHGRHAPGDCPRPTAITAGALEEYVLDMFWRGMIGAELAVEQVDDGPFVAALEEAERELRAYVESVDASVLGPELYRQGAEQRRRRMEAARAELAEHSQDAHGLPYDLGAAWPGLDLRERRRVLRGAIGAVVVYPASGRGRTDPVATRARVVWADEAPDLGGAGSARREVRQWPDGVAPVAEHGDERAESAVTS